MDIQRLAKAAYEVHYPTDDITPFLELPDSIQCWWRGTALAVVIAYQDLKVEELAVELSAVGGGI